MRLISSFLEQDLASGDAVRVVASATINGATRVLVLKDDGSLWCYLSQQEVTATGEIAREVSLPDNATPQEITAELFYDVLARALKLV